jgi:endogenous inhibitor of DNA gyrase (YacG/DUF329 family)
VSARPRSVPCPRCGKQVAWVPQNAFRPFCSERCKMVDLGAWAAEEYRVAAAEQAEEPGAPPAEPPVAQ